MGEVSAPQRMSLTVEHLKHHLIICWYLFSTVFLSKFWFAYTCYPRIKDWFSVFFIHISRIFVNFQRIFQVFLTHENRALVMIDSLLWMKCFEWSLTGIMAQKVLHRIKSVSVVYEKAFVFIHVDYVMLHTSSWIRSRRTSQRQGQTVLNRNDVDAQTELNCLLITNWVDLMTLEWWNVQWCAENSATTPPLSIGPCSRKTN